MAKKTSNRRQGGVTRSPRKTDSPSPKRRTGPTEKTSTAAARRASAVAIVRPAAEERDGGSSPPIVVGVGASAGGLEAFTELLSHLPRDTGMAFVLVQHLDPSH